MITAPATLSSVPRPSRSTEPSPVAVIPSTTNTTVKRRQKMAAGSITRRSRSSPSLISASETPDTADR